MSIQQIPQPFLHILYGFHLQPQNFARLRVDNDGRVVLSDYDGASADVKYEVHCLAVI